MPNLAMRDAFVPLGPQEYFGSEALSRRFLPSPKSIDGHHMVESVIRCLRKYSSRDKDVGSQYNLPVRLVTRSASRSSLLRSLFIASEPGSYIGEVIILCAGMKDGSTN